MKETRKLNVIYFMISLVMLLMICFGCSHPVEIDYIHTVNGYDVYYIESDHLESIEMAVNHLMEHSDNFVVQSDLGIIEVENGEIIYNNVK